MTVDEMLQNTKTTTNSANFNDNTRTIYPMEGKDFLRLSDEEKKAYIEDLRELWDATDQMIGMMLGLSRVYITQLSRRVGAETRGIKRECTKKREFFDWVRKSRADLSGQVYPAQHLADDGLNVEENDTDDTTKGKLSMVGTIGDAATMMQAMATRDSSRYAITVTWGFEVA